MGFISDVVCCVPQSNASGLPAGELNHPPIDNRVTPTSVAPRPALRDHNNEQKGSEIQHSEDNDGNDSLKRFEQTLEKTFRLETVGPGANEQTHRDIHVIRIYNDPNISVIPDFLTSEECACLIKAADPFWERSLTSKGYVRADQVSSKKCGAPTSSSLCRKSTSKVIAKHEPLRRPGFQKEEPNSSQQLNGARQP